MDGWGGQGVSRSEILGMRPYEKTCPINDK